MPSMLLYGRVETMTEAGQVEAVYLEGDRIADVGSLQDLSARYPGAKKQFFEQITPVCTKPTPTRRCGACNSTAWIWRG